MRILTEHLDVASLLNADDAAVDEFLLTHEGSASNKLWHKYISKGKVRNKIWETYRKFASPDEYKGVEEFFLQEDKILGMVVHPSIAASQMACFPNLAAGGSSKNLSFIGETTLFSERTLSYAVYYFGTYLLGAYVPTEQDYSKSLKSIDETGEFMNHAASLQRRVLVGRQALIDLNIRLLDNWTDPLLKSPPPNLDFLDP